MQATRRLAGALAVVAAGAAASGCTAVATFHAAGRSTAAPAPVSTAPAGATSDAWRLLVEPHDGFGAVYSFLASARHSIDVTMYELNDPTAEQALAAAAARGVAVRVLLDHAWSGASYNATAFAWLHAHGVAVRWASSSAIFHQKTITVDGRESLVATFNLGDTSNYYATSRDFGVFDANRSDVAAIESVFAGDWSGAAPAAPDAAEHGADLVWSPGSRGAILQVIAGAHHLLYVESEELKDAAVVAALVAAAHRGVHVTVAMTDQASWAPAFRALTAAGAHVATYAPSAPLYIHAKTVVADPGYGDGRAFVGSENLSPGSLDYNRELGLVLTERHDVAALAAVVRQDAAGGQSWAG